MKSLLKVVVLIFVLGFISCTDNKKIVPENGTTELQSINQGDSTTEDGDGVEDPDMDED
ncbi:MULTISPECIES: hypothetical protein [unclassified Tenacibaculum]|uniref:hypothetical protein n=1 Tax=unclassified Tenacibaculum TaxID=2635139 RepID=UPI001F24D683|nr:MULTISPECIES: hypothetical protein [unclassified Tenacibaculum]MCF2874072.1 hypothetical protein [Tenacibaculum sp. Cn5-1]MCF2934653.1 hypothetical protein [Tenacibaculum sp. Cn5-34]MCG7510863.1 hypothetical protein [Tenacibaculum sp. Cn5-46]